MLRRLVACGLMLAVALGTAAAREDRDDKTSGDRHSDKAFVLKASESGMAEVDTARLALRMASHDAVRKFAQKMVEDHGKANAELLELANKKGYKLAPSMDADHAASAKKLATLEGKAFDKEYITGQVKDHELAVTIFDKQAKDGSDKELAAWAKKTVPHLREHLKMAKNIHARLEGKGGDRKDRD